MTPQTQQTDIELTSGTVKADVQKITQDGGHFTIHTKTAVIGVVGTTFLVKSDSKGTTVCNTTPNSNGSAEVTVTDVNGTQRPESEERFLRDLPVGRWSGSRPLGSGFDVRDLGFERRLRPSSATAVAGAAVGLSTGLIVAIVAAGAVGLSLGLVAATGGFSSGSDFAVVCAETPGGALLSG